jgi:hypothetical protein
VRVTAERLGRPPAGAVRVTGTGPDAGLFGLAIVIISLYPGMTVLLAVAGVVLLTT